MLYGVSYYPEHKDIQTLKHDLKLIKESGINTVRMGEFAWCKFEPKEGEYQFDWLDSVIDQLYQSDIKTLLCTPTACPPVWLVEKHPDILYVDNRGVKRPFGGRRHYCYNNEVYRKYSAKIAEKIAIHYGNNPAIVGFQIDNEPAQEGTGRCCCNVCSGKFQEYLRNKYCTIEEYNKRSGSVFWSQEYTSFSQIQLPVNSIEPESQEHILAHFENPTLRLEFERFSSDSQIEYQNIQTRILKKHTSHPVTTNATGLATNSIDYYNSTQSLDCYGFDYYPNLRDAPVSSFPYAFGRGIKPGSPFWVMEFMSGGGHRLRGSGRLQPNPGSLKQAVIHSMAHGSEMMLHFQYRSFPFGAEQLNYSIVNVDGVPRRHYYEMKETANELKTLERYEQSTFQNEVAICFDYDSHWALRIKPINDPLFNYPSYCENIYKNLSHIGVNSDVISINQSFDKYKVIILPASFILSKENQQKLDSYVKSGGILISTFLTSVKNPDNVGYTDSLPSGLTDVFGMTIEEVEPVFAKSQTALEIKIDGLDITVDDGIWSEIISGECQKIGVYSEDYKKGCGVISKNSYGDGSAYYIGTNIKDNAMRSFLSKIMELHAIQVNPIKEVENVEVVRRNLDGKDIYFVFNFTSKDASIPLDFPMNDCITQQIYKNRVNLSRNGYKILDMNE